MGDKKILTFTVLLALFLYVGNVQAATQDILEGMASKFTRGLINLVTGIVELPYQTYKGYANGVSFIKNPYASSAVGTAAGLLRGVTHTAGRINYGLLEVAGFWTANPQDYHGIGEPFDAEYSWEWGSQYSIFEPTVEEGVKPLGRKFVYGVANGVAGIVEVPGQIMKGAYQGRILTGTAKGFWFWLSREAYGLNEAATFFLPNPQTHPGYPFEEKWPWTALQYSL